MSLENLNSQSSASAHVYVVEASAGAGKTYALARRYVQLLFNSFAPQEQAAFRNILALTFTNKAAFEMKERILEFIKTIALKKKSEEELNDLLSFPTKTFGGDSFGINSSPCLNREQASQKAFVMIDELLKNYNFFQVQTIDSFINALLSGCAFRLGLSANFKIKKDSRATLEFSLDRLIDRALQEPEVQKIFENFLNQYLFLENRTGWFPKKDIMSLVGTLFSKMNMLGLNYDQKSFSSSQILIIKKNILTLMNELKDNLPEGTDSRFSKILERFLHQAGPGFDTDSISDYFAREEFPVKKDYSLPSHVEGLWRDIRRQLQRLCEIESISIFNCYIDIFQKIFQDFKSLARKEDVLFLEELNKQARRLFDEQLLSVEELYYRLAARFRHYLMDEFQDTSVLQWKNLMRMVEEALSTGGSLFYVGDKKQAIYSFRGGEVALFDEIKKRFGLFGVSVETLEKNYRSQKRIVEFNNFIFSQENLRRFMERKENDELDKKKRKAIRFSPQEKDEIIQVFEHSKQSFLPQKFAGYVKIELIEPQNKEERDSLIRDRLCALIEDLRRRFSLRDIACLARDNQEVEKITSWLLAEGISVESERTSNIRENFLIKELISFLRFLDSPIDNLNFASFILGDIFSSALGLDVSKMNQFIFSYRTRITKEKDFYLYKEFRKKYPHLWESFLEEFFKSAGYFPLYELVLNIVQRFQCLQNFPLCQGYLMRFLELIKEQEEEHSDMNSFLEYFDEATIEDLYVNVTDADNVKVTTIHKSKGLEFPVVIIPFLGMEVQVGSGGQGEKSYVVEVQDEHLQLIHLKQKYLSFSENLSTIYQQEYKKAFLSELNAVYVALTRAAEEMYLFVPKRMGNSFNLMRFLLPEENLETGSPLNHPPKSRPVQVVFKLPSSDYRHWIEFLKDEFIDLKPISKREKILKGELVHFALSRIGNIPYGKEEVMVKQAMATLEEQFPGRVSTDFPDLGKVLLEMMNTKELRPFFVVESAEIFQEKEIVTSNGQTRRMDRLIVKEKEVWIVDYKSQREGTGIQQQQVREYAAILEGLYPKRMVKGFLIYLDKFEVEEVS